MARTGGRGRFAAGRARAVVGRALALRALAAKGEDAVTFLTGFRVGEGDSAQE
jgi:hypothetical protein